MTGRYRVAAALAVLLAAGAVQAEEGSGLLLAQACAGCHGQDGAGQGAIPAIAGLDREAFLSAWAEFRADARPATVMNRIAKGYTEEEVALLADHFASLQ
jgi:sulfide dehydrogenase cytochrome subunit